MKRRKFLKVAVSLEEYADLNIRADKAGLTQSAFVRAALANDRQAVEVEAILARIEETISAITAVSTSAQADSLEPLLMENLLLTREIVAERNAQVLARVSQKINSLFPERKKP